MPATFSRFILSGSTSGRPIPVVSTATPGTLIHTAIDGAAKYDEVFLYATNVTASSVALTIEWGGVATGDHVVHSYTIPANSPPVLVVPGLTLNGALVIRAFAASASAINLSGFCNRIQ
jgi:hypothetical protein